MLQRPRTTGAMSLPDFLYCYWSANIRAMLYWLRKDTTASWVIVERASIQFALLPVLCAMLPISQSLSNITSNPVVKYSIKIFYQFRCYFKLSDPPLATPVVRNPMFISPTIGVAFDSWSNNGINSLHDLYIDGTYASFDQLVNKFDIPRLHFYRYLQF